MDPISHGVIGRLVARAGSRSNVLPKGAPAAGSLGALSPDIDFVLMPMGWDIYLRAHEIGTHSAIGAIAMGLAAAGVVRLVSRGSRYTALATASAAGAMSHVIADIVSGATIRPAWPLLDVATPVPLVAMADPWPIAILAGGLLWLWRFRPASRRGARRVLLALLAFLAVKAVLLGLAWNRPVNDWPPAGQRIVEARWGSLTEWHVFARRASELTGWTIAAFGETPRHVLSVPIGEESDLIAASRSLDTVRNFLHVHDLAFATQRALPGGRQAVLWSDIRFCRAGATDDGFDCALWFGGIYGPDGRPLTQQVRVGAWMQNRPQPADE